MRSHYPGIAAGFLILQIDRGERKRHEDPHRGELALRDRLAVNGLAMYIVPQTLYDIMARIVV